MAAIGCTLLQRIIGQLMQATLWKFLIWNGHSCHTGHANNSITTVLQQVCNNQKRIRISKYEIIKRE